MFDPKPKLHEGSIPMGHGVRCYDNTRAQVVRGDDGAPWLSLSVMRDSIDAPADDALAVLRPVDPVWKAALEVVRAYECPVDASPYQALTKLHQTVIKLRAAMAGEEVNRDA